MMMPAARPRITRDELQRYIVDARVTEDVVLVGRRGYYLDSMGERGMNDRGIYDDMLALVTPHGCTTFNANLDPSVYRAGIATLIPGVWYYKLGIHGLSKPKTQQYQALVQAKEVVVQRDGKRGFDRGWFGINIHRGGVNTTSSAGCQTLPPAQWPAFIELVKAGLARARQTVLPYVLTANE